MGDSSEAVYLVPGVELEPVSVSGAVPAGVPIPAAVDLFGDEVAQLLQRTSKAALADWRNRMLRAQIGPGDYIARVMADAYEKGDIPLVLRCAELLLPYTLPKLNAVMVAPGMGAPGAGVAMGGGVLKFTWEAPSA